VLFISSFPQELQRAIKWNLNQKGQLPQAPDGSRLPPLCEHLTEAAGVEIKLKELAKEIESLKQQIQESQSPIICKTQRPLSQLEPATKYTELETDHTEPAKEYTELATDHTEPAKEYTKLAKDYMEPTIADTENSMDVTIPVASMNMEKAVTTTKLLDLEEWKAASINVMDTPMELVHTVIKIPDIIIDEPDTENNVNQEEILDQPTQPETLDHLPNLVKIQNLLLAEKSKEDHKFPAIPGKFWIPNIKKCLEIKIFNKKLFKPHLDIFGLLWINNHLSQHLEIKIHMWKNQKTRLLVFMSHWLLKTLKQQTCLFLANQSNHQFQPHQLLNKSFQFQHRQIHQILQQH
jgi:hypothetical protein